MRAAFTLIELLVVVAIIAVIASLLLPAAAMVRSKSRVVACLSNLRQVGLGIAAYASDHHGLVPSAKLANGGDHWFELIAGYCLSGGGGAVDMGNDAFDRRNVIVGCPSYPRTRDWRPGYGLNDHLYLPHDRRTSYWYHAATGRTEPRGDFRLDRITETSTRPLAGGVDGWTIGISTLGPVWHFGRDDSRHRGRPNWLFCDLHVATSTTDRIPALVFDPARAPQF